MPGSEDPVGVAMFARVVGAPEDRNLVDFYADGGLTFTGMIPGRADDAFAVGFAYTNISNRVSASDVDFGEPVARNYEALIEVCYTYQINPGWSVQPELPVYLPARRQRRRCRGRNGRGGTYQHQLLTKDECTHTIPGLAIASSSRP